MNRIIERFITPRMVEKYYDKTILLSPLFLLLTAVYAVTSWRVFHSLHGKDLLLVMILIACVWVHFIVQHSWFRGGDIPTLKTNAAKTTIAFGVLYILTVGVLLRMK